MNDSSLAPIRAAHQHFESGEYREALEALETAFLIDPTAREAHRLAGLIQRMLGNSEFADAFERVARDPLRAELLYDLGYRFIDYGVLPLAVAFLERAAAFAPEDANILYEYGWALFKTGQFQRSIPLFAQAHAIDPDYRTLVCLADAHALLADSDRAQGYLDAARAALPEDAEAGVLDDTADLIARLRFLAAKGYLQAELGLRAWHWIQTGGAILTFVNARERARDFVMTPSFLARIGAAVVRLCRVQSYRPETIEFLDPAAELPAEVLAEALGISSRRGRTEPGERAVLYLVSATAALDPHLEAFDTFEPGRVVVTLVHDWTRDAPLCPDVIGVFAERADFPWMTQGSAPAIDPERMRRETRAVLTAPVDEDTTIASFYRGLPLALSRDRAGRRPGFPVESPVPFSE